MKITETPNDLPRATPTKELMNIFIEGINDNIPNRNGNHGNNRCPWDW
jgi:hypothetical protein